MTEISDRMFARAQALTVAAAQTQRRDIYDAAEEMMRDAIKVRRLERFADEVAREAAENMALMDEALTRGEIEAIGRKH